MEGTVAPPQINFCSPTSPLGWAELALVTGSRENAVPAFTDFLVPTNIPKVFHSEKYIPAADKVVIGTLVLKEG